MKAIGLGGAMGVLLLAAGVPAAGQDTLNGLGPVRGYSGEVFDTTAARYDILVDASRPEDPSAGRYQTLQAAYVAAPAGTRERPTVIGILPDVYQLRGTETEPGLVITKPNITLMGLTRDRRNVVLADNRGNKQGAANNGFSMMVDADGFSAVNLTILNYCNVDYDYPGDPSKSLKRRSGVITQAVAIQMTGDRHVYSHVAILSRLDTMFNRTKRSYFTHSYLEGTDDYLGAPGGSVWEDSEINFIEGGGILFAGGTTFIRTRFRAVRPMQFYKVPVAPVALIESTLPDVPVAWFGWRAPDHSSEASLTYRTTTDSGRPVDIIDSIVGKPKRTLAREMTEAQSRAFNPWNLLRWTADGVDDGWDPAGARARYEGLGARPFRIKLTNGVARARTTEAPIEIAAVVQPKGSTSKIGWTTSSPLVRLSAAEGDRVIVTPANTTDQTQVVAIAAKADNGFSSTAYLTIDPAYRPSPMLTGAPVVRAAGPGKLRVDYGLKLLPGRKDQSLVTWFACADATCAHPERIAISRGDTPLQTLAVSKTLTGRHVMATIEPKHDLSLPGPALRTAAVLAKPDATQSAAIDLRSLPDSAATDRWEGDWRLMGSWTSQSPFEGETHWGLRVGGQDSSLLYVGQPSAGDMDVTVAFDTDKLEGQGFAIAGSPEDDGRPRAEILFKYDPATRNGYALRFWRTTRSATACVFQLYKVTDGHGTPIGEQRLTGVIKPTTTIRIAVRGAQVTVKGANTADGETLDLSGAVEPNAHGGAGFYWTSSRPSGSVVLRGLSVAYPEASAPRGSTAH
jgi:hypothetical protein